MGVRGGGLVCDPRGQWCLNWGLSLSLSQNRLWRKLWLRLRLERRLGRSSQCRCGQCHHRFGTAGDALFGLGWCGCGCSCSCSCSLHGGGGGGRKPNGGGHRCASGCQGGSDCNGRFHRCGRGRTGSGHAGGRIGALLRCFNRRCHRGGFPPVWFDVYPGACCCAWASRCCKRQRSLDGLRSGG